MILGWFYGHTYVTKLGLAFEAKRFVFSGLSSLTLFTIFRFVGIGDFLLPDATIQGFLGLSKYPPSPDYYLLYLGLVFLLFYLFYRLPTSSRLGRILENFGRAPLFFYNTHLWLYAAVPAILANFNGYSLMFGVGVWLIGLFILYPLCHGYLRWRSSSKVLAPRSRIVPGSRPVPRSRLVRRSKLVHLTYTFGKD